MTINHPKVSIITITYNIIEDNRKEYFQQMFDSIHNQTYQNIEHIIIDGASTDGSLEYIKLVSQHAKKDIKIFSEPDTGIYNAMNKGIKKSSGFYLVFMNTDDYYYTNNAIELLVTACQNKQATFACGNGIVLHDSRKITEFNADISSCFHRMPFCHQSMICEKNLFDKYGLFDESFKIAADYDFIVKIIANHEVGTQVDKKDILVLFRWTGISFAIKDIAVKEAAIVLKKYYNAKFISLGDCESIFRSNLSIKTYLKIQLFYLLYASKILSYHQFIKSSGMEYLKRGVKQYFKNLIRFRSIIRIFEKIYKKLTKKNNNNIKEK